MTQNTKLIELCQYAGQILKSRITWADPAKLMISLAMVESSLGMNSRPRHEPAYDFGGLYWNKEHGKPWRWDIHGSISACSFSSWQIMFPTAVELGLDPLTHPCELQDDSKAVHWVIEYIKRRILDRGAVTLANFAVGYNGGNPSAFNDQTIKYAKKLELAYNSQGPQIIKV